MAEIAGLKLIVPTSVSAGGSASASVSATGKVTFTNLSNTTDELKVNGCFTSLYDNYLIVVRHTDSTGGNGYVMRLRAAGSDATGSNYAHQSISGDGATPQAARTTGTSLWNVSLTGGTDVSGMHIYLFGPYLAQPTALRSVNVTGSSSVRVWDFANTHSLSTSYDGFAFYPAVGTSTGALTIYGLSQ